MTRAWAVRWTAAAVVAGGGLYLMNSMAPLQMPTVLAYSGIVVFAGGLASVVLPRRWSGFPRRIYGPLAGLLVGAALVVAGWNWPSGTFRAAAQGSELDAILPVYHFHERHEATIDAPPEKVREALDAFAFSDIGAMQTLGRIRAAAMGARVPAKGNGVEPAVPFLKTMQDSRSGFFPLADTPREVVFGIAGRPWGNVGVRLTPEQFRTWSPLDTVKVAANFRIEDAGGGKSRVITETRVAASDEGARRKMARYWALIYPGSGMVRRGLLEAIAKRAEGR